MGAYEEGQTPLVDALVTQGVRLTYIRNHEAALAFPSTPEAFNMFDVIVFSDIGADTLLLHPDTMFKSKTTPNRLKLLGDYVESGGGFMMVGGYMSFGGLDGLARYANTALADVLPVVVSPHDDRVEAPEGIVPEVVDPDHFLVAHLSADFPPFLGYNRFSSKPGTTVVMKVGADPLLVIGAFGRGRTAAFASDCSPHWATPEFITSPLYKEFWGRLVLWLAGKDDIC
jgi:uncharacterized membrane protein